MAIIFAIIISPTLVAHSLYVFVGFSAFKQDSELPFAGRTFWEFGPDAVSGGLAMVVLQYVVVIVGLIVLALLAWGTYALVRWAFFKNIEVVCTDKKCRCVMHGGVSYQNYQDDLERDALLALAIST